MKNAPRASLSITILDDEDYRVLMAHNSGLEAFGVFVAMLICGRERLQQDKARQLSESESLTFDNSTTHILALTHVTQRQLDRCLKTLFEVAKDCNSKPWMYLDESSHLVIRSFFKFNTSSGWGGARVGAGKKSRGNQDEKNLFQDEKGVESSRNVSGTGTGTGIKPPTPLRGENGVCVSVNGSEPEPADPDSPLPIPAFQNDPEAVKRAMATADRLFPTLDYGAKVFQLQSDYDVAVLEAAMRDAADGTVKTWKYIAGIYRNRMNDGRGASQPPTARASPPPKVDRDHVPLSTPAELERQIADYEARYQAKQRAKNGAQPQ